jgi:diamine N-acetyltransferase
MRPDDIDSNPALITATVQTRSDETVTLRPLRPDDAAILGDYLLGLSEQTRNLYAPHPFDRKTAEQLCANIDSADTMRFLAVKPGTEPQVLAYFVLVFGVIDFDKERYGKEGMPLDGETDCSIGPSVADAYQDSGLGSLMMKHLLDVVQRMGFKRMLLLGGVRQHNGRAIHFYEKFGFVKVREFTTRAPNFDMIAAL